MELNQEKLQKWAEQVHYNATLHGWHDEEKSDAHWRCMILTEVAEAIEADRKDKRANTQAMKDILETQKNSEVGLSEQWYKDWFPVYFKEYIKGSVEEEFADICIRIFDFAFEKYGKLMKWEEWHTNTHSKLTFTERAFYLVKWMTEEVDCDNLSLAIYHTYQWAKDYGIDLDWHIEAKMKYNESRPFKHGKKY